MKEYTLLAIISVMLTLLLCRKSPARLLERKEFYLFMLVILFFKFMVNGYLTASLIVVYNPRFFLNVRVGSIPVEDFLFGFSMVTLTILLWEHFKKSGSSSAG